MNTFFSSIQKYIPIPKTMAFNHAGVDIGVGHVRYMSFKKKSKGIVIDTFGVVETKAPLDRTKPLVEQDDLIQVLKRIQKETGYKYVEASLPEDLVYIYTTEVDMTDEVTMRTQIEFKLEENVPVKVEEAVFDVTQVVEIPSANKVLVSVAVVPKKVVEDYMTVFREAGMEVVSFLVQNQALAKTLIAKNDSDPYCIVAVERKNIVVSVVSAGIVLYTTTIEQSVFKENLELERTEVLQELVREVYKVIFFWLSYIEKNPQYGFKPLKAILLCSTHRDILESDFASMITRELAFQVKVADVWTNVHIPENTVPQISKKDSYQYATAIGLAIPKV